MREDPFGAFVPASRRPPRLDLDPEARQRLLHPTLCLMSIAGAGGLPQVRVPCRAHEGRPIGLSLLGAPGSDEALLDVARGLLDPRSNA